MRARETGPVRSSGADGVPAGDIDLTADGADLPAGGADLPAGGNDLPASAGDGSPASSGNGPPSSAGDGLEAALRVLPVWSIFPVLAVAAVLALALSGLLPTGWRPCAQGAVLYAVLIWWVFRVVPRRAGSDRPLLGPVLAPRGLGATLGVALGAYGFAAAMLRLSQITALPLGAAESDPVTLPLDGPTWANVAVAIGMGPLAEELLFRGVLFRKWRQTFGPVKGWVFSALLFGALHPKHVLDSALFGAVLALLYTSTQSLWGPILAHGIVNALFIFPPLWLGGYAPWLELELLPALLVLGLSAGGLLWFARRAWSTLGVGQRCSPPRPG